MSVRYGRCMESTSNNERNIEIEIRIYMHMIMIE
jgi:hypothetical protein